MKSLPPRFGPWTRKDFIIHLIASFLIQASLSLLAWAILRILKPHIVELSSIFLLLVIVLSSFFFATFVFDPKRIKARFADVFVGRSLSSLSYYSLVFVPIVFVSFSGFLAMRRTPVFLSRNYFKSWLVMPLVVIIIAAQIYSAKFAYLGASPAISYISVVLQDAQDILQFKESHDYLPNSYKKFLSDHPGKVRSNQNVLLVAVSATFIFQGKKRDIASGNTKKEAARKALFELLDTSFAAIENDLNYELTLSDYGPLAWLHPGNPIEILLIEMVDNEIRHKFRRTLLKKSSGLLAALEQSISEASPDARMSLLPALKILQERFKILSSQS